jgi:hypothetical protein
VTFFGSLGIGPGAAKRRQVRALLSEAGVPDVGATALRFTTVA